MSDTRPDPDALLAATRTGGRLHLWFGFAPGVGKTCAMLDAAHEAAKAGVDLLLGVVETHGRSETAARAEGLPRLPPRVVVQGGSRFEELDLDAALARRPSVLVVDELAHTNAVGSRHPKRWQDVMELLDAGIDVYTTLNVQHVESLREPVTRATGVLVRETVPDAVLDRADAIELIDLPPEALIERLRAGKVYLPAQAERALRHFFTPGNLLSLRELALRRTVARVDDDVRAWRAAHPGEVGAAVGRLAVAVGASPASAGLVRAARRMADGLGVGWFAVHVQDPASPPAAAEMERVDAHLALAGSLGAEVVRLSGRSLEAAIVPWARQVGVTRLVVGRPTHAAWRDRLFGSRLDALVRAAGDLDVLVTAGTAAGAVKADAPPPAPAAAWLEAVLAVAGAAALGVVGRPWLAAPDIVVLFLLAISAVAARGRSGPSALAASLSVAAYDVIFVEPFGTFAVTDSRNLLTFAVMFAAGMWLTALLSRLRRQQDAAIDRERHTAALLALSRSLTTAEDGEAVRALLARAAAATLQVPVRVLGEVGDGGLPADARAVAQWALDHATAAGTGTDTLPAAGVRCLPLVTPGGVRGVLVAEIGRNGMLAPDARELVDAFVRLAALAAERVALSEALAASRVAAEAEGLRSALLSAVSHDLRTPLAVITGAASVLTADEVAADPVTRAELLADIEAQARRMERRVSNLLEITRLSAGAVEAKRTWVPADEVVGAALEDALRVDPTREVGVRVEPVGLLLHVDPLLLQHALINLIENALRHTSSAVRVGVGGGCRAGMDRRRG